MKNMVAFGQGTLDRAKSLEKGDTIKCPHCSKSHKIVYGKDVDGLETSLLSFYKCGNTTYLAGVKCKSVMD